MHPWHNRRLDEIVSTITDTRNLLKRQTDLSPRNGTVNEALTLLVRYVTLPHNEKLAHRALIALEERGVVRSLRELCQQAEFQLELYYSAPGRMLQFPYIDHYLELALVESELAHLRPGSKAVFVGGGPLPWTPLALTVIQAAREMGMLEELRRCLQATPRKRRRAVVRFLKRMFWREWSGPFQVVSVERDPLAARQAREALASVSLSAHVPVVTSDGAAFVVPPGCDTFFIASMVQEKAQVMLNIMAQCEPGKDITFLVRSVQPHNLRAVLYEPVEAQLDDLEACVPDLAWSDTFLPAAGSYLINSVHVYRYRKPALPRLCDLPSVSA